MKKLFLMFILLFFGIGLVSAYHIEGEVIDLGYLTTDIISDTDFSDGYVKYIYCAYEFDSPTDVECTSLEDLNGSCDISEFIPFEGGCMILNGNPMQINLVKGTSTWDVMISSIDMTYDEEIEDWVIGVPTIIDSKTETYKTVKEPDLNVLYILLQKLKQLICQIFPFGFCEYSPNTSLDCDWCNNECVEWQKLPNGLEGCNRIPPEGKVCVAELAGEHKICTARIPVPQGDLITFCSETEISRMADFFEGNFSEMDDFLRRYCDGMTFPLDNCPTKYESYEFTYEQGTKTGAWMECKSECTDDSGNVVGGHIIWNFKYDFNLNQLVGVQPISVLPYPTDSCI